MPQDPQQTLPPETSTCATAQSASTLQLRSMAGGPAAVAADETGGGAESTLAPVSDASEATMMGALADRQAPSNAAAERTRTGTRRMTKDTPVREKAPRYIAAFFLAHPWNCARTTSDTMPWPRQSQQSFHEME